MLQLPGTQQFVDVLRGNLLEVFFHDLQFLQTDVQQLLVGHVVDRARHRILVHQLLQAIQALRGLM